MRLTRGVFISMGFLVFLAVALPVPASATGLQGENLLAPLPEGFKLGSQSIRGAISLTEYAPENETAENWSRLVTVEIFHNKTGMDPESYNEKMAAKWKAACAGGDAEKIKDGMENGYPISLWLFTCPMNAETHKPENTWVKAIGGGDAFYAVQYAYRQELNKDLVGPAMHYLEQVTVCDTRGAGHACPDGVQ